MTRPTERSFADSKHDVLDDGLENVAPVMDRVFTDIRDHPELAFGEHHAVATITRELGLAGFSITQPYCGLDTAFRADFGSPDAAEGGHVGLIVHYDALPELGHACGHHVIVAGMVGAALAMAPYVERHGGRLTVFGCPAEEEGGGKVIMAGQNAFAGLDAALMFHPYRRTSVFNEFLAMTAFKVVVEGQPAHASTAPERGVNALEVLLGAHTVVNGMRPSFGRRCRLNFVVHEGGTVGNIVPARASGTYFINNVSPEAASATGDKVKKVVSAIADVVGAEVQIVDHTPYRDVVSNQVLGTVLVDNMQELNLTIDAMSAEFDGYTDIGDVSYQAPTIYPMIGLGEDVTPHTLAFRDISAGEHGRRVAREGAAALVGTALDVLASPELRALIHEDFQRTVNSEQ